MYEKAKTLVKNKSSKHIGQKEKKCKR